MPERASPRQPIVPDWFIASMSMPLTPFASGPTTRPAITRPGSSSKSWTRFSIRAMPCLFLKCVGGGVNVVIEKLLCTCVAYPGADTVSMRGCAGDAPTFSRWYAPVASVRTSRRSAFFFLRGAPIASGLSATSSAPAIALPVPASRTVPEQV